MKPSPGIEELIRESMRRFELGDFSMTLRTTSKQPGVVAIGTAPEEYLRGYEAIVAQFRGEMDATPHLSVAVD